MPLGLSGNGLITGFDPTASGFGKILQVVRATDTTQRSTTSATYVDANISVTITPQKSNSNILVIWSGVIGSNSFGQDTDFQITDSSNNTLSGAERARQVLTNENAYLPLQLFAWVAPATTSAVTYKLRWREFGGGSAIILNDQNTGQMFAIEVAA